MRFSAYLLVAAALVGLMCSAAMAQPDQNQTAPPQPAAGQAPPAAGEQPGMGDHRGQGQGRDEMERYGRYRNDNIRERIANELNLTDQQKEQVKTAFRETMEANKPSEADRAKMQQLRDQLKTAQENGDEAGFQQAMDQLSQTWEARQKAFADQLTPKLQAILTPEQMTKAKAMLAPRPGHKLGRLMMEIRTLDLTDAQYDQVKAILDDAHDKVMNVLTPDQKEQLMKRMAHPMGGPGEGMHRGEGRREGRRMREGAGATSQPAGAAPAMP